MKNPHPEFILRHLFENSLRFSTLGTLDNYGETLNFKVGRINFTYFVNPLPLLFSLC